MDSVTLKSNRCHQREGIRRYGGVELLLFCLQVLANALLSSKGGEGGVTTERRGDARSLCEASLFSRERSRHGQRIPLFSFLSSFVTVDTLLLFRLENFLCVFRAPPSETHQYLLI